ncbi:MAG TPA: 3-oxoacyl-[acyl-carrier-protein] synthase III C-terminal domain-containing protein [Anaerolineales bacterium]|nr:3-oxoacyl-[acyl-carrier-protein] synthase III C-terminal domain-containing protein [Anaerolineales bacterium]
MKRLYQELVNSEFWRENGVIAFGEFQKEIGMPVIVSAKTGLPEHYYPQETLLTAAQQEWKSKRPSIVKPLEQFYTNVKVNGRYLSWPLERYTEPTTFEERNNAYIETALELGEQTICALLDYAQMNPQEIDQLTTISTTGIAVPSLDARLMNRIPFSRGMKRLPLFGLGCVGGAAGIARTADYLQGHPEEAVILFAVELCSLTIQRDDLSMANLVASGLFGDGAAAVLMVGDDHPRAQCAQSLPRVIDSQSQFFPETEHIMGWDVTNSGFKVLLSADIAGLAQSEVRPSMEAFLGRHDLTIAGIDHWLVHPGGPRVIQALADGLGLPDEALALSWETLAEAGNISSASVLLILDKAMKRLQPKPGEWGVLMAMGPAFCAELVLLQW